MYTCTCFDAAGRLYNFHVQVCSQRLIFRARFVKAQCLYGSILLQDHICCGDRARRTPRSRSSSRMLCQRAPSPASAIGSTTSIPKRVATARVCVTDMPMILTRSARWLSSVQRVETVQRQSTIRRRSTHIMCAPNHRMPCLVYIPFSPPLCMERRRRQQAQRHCGRLLPQVKQRLGL